MEDQNKRKLFAELSALLTGFHPTILENTTLIKCYYNYVSCKAKDQFPKLLKIWKSLLEAYERETGCGSVGCMPPEDREMNLEKLKEHFSDEGLEKIALAITKLWYLGYWYSPFDSKKPPKVVGEHSYLEGLVWQVMQSHPMGKNEMGYGHWSKEPPELAAFTGHDDTRGEDR